MSYIDDFKQSVRNFDGCLRYDQHARQFRKCVLPCAVLAWRFKKNRPVIREAIEGLDEMAHKRYDRGYGWSTEFLYYIRDIYPKMYWQWYHPTKEEYNR